MRSALIGSLGAVLVAVTVPMGVSSAAEAMTTITLRVSGCEGCTITPVQAISGSSDVYTGTAGTVKGGTVAFTVPTARTVGMSFNLEATWRVDINALPVIVTQYRGMQPGQRVSTAQAKASKHATACWAGTTEPSVSLAVRVGRVMTPGFPTGRAKVPLAYFVPTLDTTGGFSPTVKGTIAQQDAWYCPAS